MSLTTETMLALRWSAGARAVGQLANWAITIVVIRLLSPADYGLMAMVTACTGFLALIAELGLGTAVIQADSADQKTLRQVFGVAVILNGIMFIALCAAAGMIAAFFEEPRLASLVRVAALQFLIGGSAVIPDALMRRDMRFKPLATVELVSNVVGGLATLGMAVYGLGVWSLVGGQLVASLSRAGPVIAMGNVWVWPSLALAGAGRLVSYGGLITASRILWYFMSQADVLIAGKLLGKELVGIYFVANHFASLPMQRLSGVVNAVALPAFARVQHNRAWLQNNVLKAVSVMSFIAFPTLAGVSSVAPEVVSVFLGSKWTSAVLPLQLISVVIPVRMIAGLLSSITTAVGRADVDLKVTLTGALIMTPAFIVGCYWGLIGLSLSWVICVPLVFALNLPHYVGALHIRLGALLRTMMRPAFASLVMFAVVSVARSAFADALGNVALFAALVVIGVTTYATTSFLANRRGCREALQLVIRSK